MRTTLPIPSYSEYRVRPSASRIETRRSRASYPYRVNHASLSVTRRVIVVASRHLHHLENTSVAVGANEKLCAGFAGDHVLILKRTLQRAMPDATSRSVGRDDLNFSVKCIVTPTCSRRRVQRAPFPRAVDQPITTPARDKWIAPGQWIIARWCNAGIQRLDRQTARGKPADTHYVGHPVAIYSARPRANGVDIMPCAIEIAT